MVIYKDLEFFPVNILSQFNLVITYKSKSIIDIAPPVSVRKIPLIEVLMPQFTSICRQQTNCFIRITTIILPTRSPLYPATSPPCQPHCRSLTPMLTLMVTLLPPPPVPSLPHHHNHHSRHGFSTWVATTAPP